MPGGLIQFEMKNNINRDSADEIIIKCFIKFFYSLYNYDL